MKSNKIVMVILGLGLLAALTREPAAAPTPTPSAVTITYVCNAGFILETGDYKSWWMRSSNGRILYTRS